MPDVTVPYAAGPDRHYRTIAAAVHLSPHHLQRLFADWAGISPKRFLQYLTKEYAKRRHVRHA